jgi:hypothetical protein
MKERNGTHKRAERQMRVEWAEENEMAAMGSKRLFSLRSLSEDGGEQQPLTEMMQKWEV